MRLLIAVSSCKRDVENGANRAMRETWLKGTDYMFFIGGVSCPCPDDYEHLPCKTKFSCQYALDEGYDYKFQCFTDTYAVPERFPKTIPDYAGYVLRAEFPYCSGGAGYFLSRKAMEFIVKEEPNDWAEDRWVGRILHEHGIAPVDLYGFLSWRVPIAGMTSIHLSKGTNDYNPEWMREVHKEYLNGR
jgi:hypothetical protein